MPKYQVNKFEKIAPKSAERTTTCVTVSAAIKPSPIVAATAVPLKAPRTLSRAASRIAVRIGSTPVLMTVATALAASWKPLMKSNTSANRTTRTRVRTTALMATSCVLDHDGLERIAYVVAGVERFLQALEELLVLEQRDGVRLCLEHLAELSTEDLVALALQTLDGPAP